MLTTQNFLNKWQDDIEVGNEYLANQHPIHVTRDILATKLTSHEQKLHDIFLYNCDHSLRFHTKISDECNGLILDENSNLVSKAFNRIHVFGKLGTPDMDWRHVFIEPDYDGKVVVFFNYEGMWFMHTKRSTQAGEVLSLPGTGQILSYRTHIMNFIRNKNGIDNLQTFLAAAAKNTCFVCLYMNPKVHMCGAEGKEDLLLLGAIDKSPNKMNPGRQLFSAYIDDIADMLGLSRPPSLEASGVANALSIIEQLKPWRRGIIIRDDANNRIRVENPEFRPIRRLLNAGNEFTNKQLIGMFLTGAGENVSSVEPRYNEPLKILNQMIDIRVKTTQGVWNKAKDSECQKEFAARVDHSLLNYVLFHVRKHGPLNRTEFVQLIKPRLVEGFIQNIGELGAFNKSVEKARCLGEILT